VDLGRLLALLWGTVVHRPYVWAFFACFAACALHQLGWRRTATFAVTAWLVAFGAEYSSTRNGFPFGPYHYFDETRGRELWISNVPFWDSLSFVFLSYFSLALAGELLASRGPGARGTAPAILRREAPLLGAALMTLLDVVIDPVALQGEKWFLGRIYAYPYRGFYFGVTFANFAGWFVVGAVTQWLFQKEVALLPWCRGPGRPVHPRFGWAVFAVFAGVFAFNLAVTVAIGDLALAAASAAVAAGTLAMVALRLRSRGPPPAVLLCAATATEAAACRRGVAGVTGMEVLRTGVGPERAARALARRLEQGPPPALVVSAGFAGALGSDIEAGELVTARALFRLIRAAPVPVALPRGVLRLAPDARAVDLATASEVVAGGITWHGGPAAVDMESAALAERAAAAGARFAVLRLVTDTPRAPLPSFARVAASALAEPGAGRRAVLATRAAAEALRAPRTTAALVAASRHWSRALEAALRARAGRLAAAGSADGAGAGEGDRASQPFARPFGRAQS
jgi:putative membrane protein